jgi:hypothetical protein
MTHNLFDDDLGPVKIAPLVRPGEDIVVPRAVLATLKQTLVRIRNWNPPITSSKGLPEWLLVECGADVDLIDSLTGDRREPSPAPRPSR